LTAFGGCGGCYVVGGWVFPKKGRDNPLQKKFPCSGGIEVTLLRKKVVTCSVASGLNWFSHSKFTGKKIKIQQRGITFFRVRMKTDSPLLEGT